MRPQTGGRVSAGPLSPVSSHRLDAALTGRVYRDIAAAFCACDNEVDFLSACTRALEAVLGPCQLEVDYGPDGDATLSTGPSSSASARACDAGRADASALTEDHPFSRAVCAPFRADRAHGVLRITWGSPEDPAMGGGESAPCEEAAFLAELAKLIAGGFDSMAAKREAVQYTETARIAVDTIGEMAALGVVNANTVIMSLLEKATHALNAQAAGIWQNDILQDKGRMLYAYNVTADAEQPITDVIYDIKNDPSTIPTLGVVAVVDNSEEWMRLHPSITPADGTPKPDWWNAYTMLLAPLKYSDGAFNVLVVYGDKNERFSARDIERISIFASTASIAIDMAEMCEKLEHRKTHLEEAVRTCTAELQSKAEALRKSVTALTHIQERERKRMALDLHDIACQLTAGALCEIGSAQRALQKGSTTRCAAHLETSQHLIYELDAEYRKIIDDNYPHVLRSQGLAGALAHEVQLRKTTSSSAGVAWHFQSGAENANLTDTQQLMLFRIAREAMSNIERHARARIARVTLRLCGGALVMTIEDDGVGFAGTASEMGHESHFGLVGMRERAESIGAQLSISSGDEGTCIQVTLPASELAGPDEP